MANDARRVGSTFETAVVGYLRERSIEAERLARTGRLDEGDICIRRGDFIAELKARRDRNSSLNLGAWLAEARRESANYGQARGLVAGSQPTPLLIVKNPGKSIGQAFVVQYLEDWINERRSL